MQRKRRFPKILAGIVCAAMLFGVGAGAWNGFKPIPAVAAVPITHSPAVEGSSALVWPAYGQAAVGAVGYGVLATKGTQAPLAMASIAKVITALAVLEKKPLSIGEQGPLLTMTAADVALYDRYVGIDGSVVRVVEGEQISEYQILQALMLPSSNNLADTAAIWAFGSIENYHAYARQMVQRLGVTNTVFGDDASGYSPATAASAQDLILLGQAAIQHPVLAQIAAQDSAELPIAGTVRNVNSMLGRGGIIGIKTGNNDQDPGAFLGAAKVDLGNGRIVTVVTCIMGAPNLFTALSDSVALITAAKAKFRVSTLIKANQPLAAYKLPWGGKVTAVAQKDLSLVTWEDTPVRPKITLNPITKQLPARAATGNANASYAGQTASTPIILQQSAPAPGVWWRVTRQERKE